MELSTPPEYEITRPPLENDLTDSLATLSSRANIEAASLESWSSGKSSNSLLCIRDRLEGVRVFQIRHISQRQAKITCAHQPAYQLRVSCLWQRGDKHDPSRFHAGAKSFANVLDESCFQRFCGRNFGSQDDKAHDCLPFDRVRSSYGD